MIDEKSSLDQELKSFKRAGSSSRTRVEGREAPGGQEHGEQTTGLQTEAMVGGSTTQAKELAHLLMQWELKPRAAHLTKLCLF